MVRGGPGSWNVRDTHMADTLDRLLARARYGEDGTVLVGFGSHHGSVVAARGCG